MKFPLAFAKPHEIAKRNRMAEELAKRRNSLLHLPSLTRLSDVARKAANFAKRRNSLLHLPSL